jgi:hypothetical protein
LKHRPEGFLSSDEAIFYFIYVILDRPWLRKLKNATVSVTRLSNEGRNPESQQALATIDGCLVSPEDLWSHAPDSPRAQALGTLREALLAGKLHGYVFIDGYVKRIPAVFWSALKREHFFDDGRIALVSSERELILKWWLRWEEIRDYFSGKGASSTYPLLDPHLDQSLAAPTTSSSNPQKPPSKGGRPPSFEWVEIAADTVRFFHENGRPKSQSKLVEHLQSSYSNRHSGAEPGTSTLKRFVSSLWKELGSYDEEP